LRHQFTLGFSVDLSKDEVSLSWDLSLVVKMLGKFLVLREQLL